MAAVEIPTGQRALINRLLGLRIAVVKILSRLFMLLGGAVIGREGPALNLLILSPMIGFLTGVTRSPFAAAILVLEMTDRHSAIFYFLLASIAASSTARVIDRESFYESGKRSILLSLGVQPEPRPVPED